MQNKMAINDWSAIQSLFDKLNKQLEKTQKVAEQAALPRVYLRLVVELEVIAGAEAPASMHLPRTRASLQYNPSFLPLWLLWKVHRQEKALLKCWGACRTSC